MTIMFGDLSNDFVVFANILLQSKDGVAGADELLPAAAASFKKNAARSSLWLALIGE